jgi:hypothetical protein
MDQKIKSTPSPLSPFGDLWTLTKGGEKKTVETMVKFKHETKRDISTKKEEKG